MVICMKRKDILLTELLFNKGENIYTLISNTTDKYCKGTCPAADDPDVEAGCCFPEEEKKCINAWLDSEVTDPGEFFTE